MPKSDEYRSCPLCLGASPDLLQTENSEIPQNPSSIRASENDYGRHGSLVRCSSCGFTFIGNLLYVKKTVKLYKNLSDRDYLHEEKHRLICFNNILSEIDDLTDNKKGALLDIGANTGGLLAVAENSGWKASGIDPSVWACIQADKIHGIKVINRTVEAYKHHGSKFNVITMIDVIEHLESPQKALKKIHSLTDKGGIVCIVTPDYGSFAARILKNSWWGIRRAHLSYFRLIDLERLSANSGFRVIRKKYFVRYLSADYLFRKVFPGFAPENRLFSLIGRIIIPLHFFDTFEIYLEKI